jgi:hypothetical protein
MKKPALKSATPNDEEANALYSDAAHDLLTERFTDPTKSNRVLIVAIARVTEAGGHDDNGDRVTKYKLDHIEAAFSDADEKKLTDQLARMHKGRTQSNTVAALQDPVEDTPLEGVDEEINDDPDA